MDLLNNEQFFKAVEGKDIIIYGDGYVGKQFLKTLRLIGMEEKVVCFTKTAVSGNGIVDGIELKPLKDIKKLQNSVICIAVHESNKDEIIKNLEANEIYNYIWIYPVLHSLIIGNPIMENVKIPVKKILESNLDDYRIAVRYLAIENYYGKNTIGYDIYLKLMELHTSHETAVKRLSTFIELIKDWEKLGYDDTKSIDILENGILIDGTHRFSLGVYFGLNDMSCNIYDAKKYSNCFEISGEDAVMSKEVVKEKIVSRKIIKELNDTQKIIKSKFLI